MSTLLNCAYIQPTKKRCFLLDTPLKFDGITPTVEIMDRVLILMKYIENGKTIPNKHYRSSSDRRGDELLSKLGIMHLHLEHSGDDNILYLQQYGEFVLFIEVSTHKYLNSTPVGANFNMYKINAEVAKIIAELQLQNQKAQDDERIKSDRLKNAIAKLKQSTSIRNIKECIEAFYDCFKQR